MKVPQFPFDIRTLRRTRRGTTGVCILSTLLNLIGETPFPTPKGTKKNSNRSKVWSKYLGRETIIICRSIIYRYVIVSNRTQSEKKILHWNDLSVKKPSMIFLVFSTHTGLADPVRCSGLNTDVENSMSLHGKL